MKKIVKSFMPAIYLVFVAFSAASCNKTQAAPAAGYDGGSDRRGYEDRAVRADDLYEPERRVREAPAGAVPGAPGADAGDL